MEDRQPRPDGSSPDSGRNQASPTSLDNYRFTFNLSQTTLSKNSYIEPDPTIDIESSESLTESVQTFPVEFGRTYHAYRAGSYAFPNDTPEQERLALQNEALLKLLGGRLFFAPLDRNPPRAILDIATGTGDWAIQMGDHFPQATVTATDLSPIQPTDVPPNVNFYVEDSSEPWDYTHPFDYIHTRVTAGCWSSFKTQIAEQAFESLSPGGWFESQEYDGVILSDDGTLVQGGALAKYFDDMVTAGDMVDRPIILGCHLKRIYEEVGFVDVHERVYKMPTNGWPRDERLKELGRLWEHNMMQGLSGFSMSMLSRAFQRTPEEIEVSLVEVRREWSDPRVHAYMKVYVVWGRKPYPGETPSSRPIFQQSQRR